MKFNSAKFKWRKKCPEYILFLCGNICVSVSWLRWPRYTECNYSGEGCVWGGRHCERQHCVSAHTDVSQCWGLKEPWEPLLPKKSPWKKKKKSTKHHRPAVNCRYLPSSQTLRASSVRQCQEADVSSDNSYYHCGEVVWVKFAWFEKSFWIVSTSCLETCEQALLWLLRPMRSQVKPL